ncbi:hypothetical protein ACERNI_08680 [Camelimonas sp. ID_303_24]
MVVRRKAGAPNLPCFGFFAALHGARHRKHPRGDLTSRPDYGATQAKSCRLFSENPQQTTDIFHVKRMRFALAIAFQLNVTYLAS